MHSGEQFRQVFRGKLSLKLRVILSVFLSAGRCTTTRPPTAESPALFSKLSRQLVPKSVRDRHAVSPQTTAVEFGSVTLRKQHIEVRRAGQFPLWAMRSKDASTSASVFRKVSQEFSAMLDYLNRASSLCLVRTSARHSASPILLPPPNATAYGCTSRTYSPDQSSA